MDRMTQKKRNQWVQWQTELQLLSSRFTGILGYVQIPALDLLLADQHRLLLCWGKSILLWGVNDLEHINQHTRKVRQGILFPTFLWNCSKHSLIHIENIRFIVGTEPEISNLSTTQPRPHPASLFLHPLVVQWCAVAPCQCAVGRCRSWRWRWQRRCCGTPRRGKVASRQCRRWRRRQGGACGNTPLVTSYKWGVMTPFVGDISPVTRL